MEETGWQQWDGPWEALPDLSNLDFFKGLEGPLPSPRVRVEIETVDEGLHIGWVNRYRRGGSAGWWEIGIDICEERCWGRGLGTEALALWVDYLFGSTGFGRLGMSSWSGNHRIVRVAEKLGFVLEARFRNARQVRGRRYDALSWGMLRDEWLRYRKDWPGIGL